MVAAGQFYVLLGASGSGKTTLLRSIAGLETPDAGELVLDGSVVFSSAQGIWIPAVNRPIGMVFQSYALWPHMNVYENIAFPLRHGRRRIPRGEIPDRVAKVLDLLHLQGLARRPVTALSGGQQQRVALARALALEPKALLMDEPLSNLDAKLRIELRGELRALTRRLQITTVYVTHDQTEALALADTIGIMHGGELVEEGSPTQLYRHPRSLVAAKFLGEMNFFQGVVRDTEGSCYRVAIGPATIKAMGQGPIAAGDAVLVGVRPESVRLAAEPGENRLPARVVEGVFLGEHQVYQFRVGDQLIQLKLPPDAALPPGAPVFLEIPPDKALVFCT